MLTSSIKRCISNVRLFASKNIKPPDQLIKEHIERLQYQNEVVIKSNKIVKDNNKINSYHFNKIDSTMNIADTLL